MPTSMLSLPLSGRPSSVPLHPQEPLFQDTTTKAKIFHTREDVAAALLVLRAQPRLSPSRPLAIRVPTRREARRSPGPPARRPRVVTPSVADLIVVKVC